MQVSLYHIPQYVLSPGCPVWGPVLSRLTRRRWIAGVRKVPFQETVITMKELRSVSLFPTGYSLFVNIA